MAAHVVELGLGDGQLTGKSKVVNLLMFGSNLAVRFDSRSICLRARSMYCCILARNHAGEEETTHRNHRTKLKRGRKSAVITAAFVFPFGDESVLLQRKLPHFADRDGRTRARRSTHVISAVCFHSPMTRTQTTHYVTPLME